MKINTNGVNSSLTGIENAKQKGMDGAKDKKESSSLGAVELKDSSSINLSERAQRMNKAKEIATKADDINHEKVAQLQKLIDEGNYKVDAEAVADRLVDQHLVYPD